MIYEHETVNGYEVMSDRTAVWVTSSSGRTVAKFAMLASRYKVRAMAMVGTTQARSPYPAQLWGVFRETVSRLLAVDIDEKHKPRAVR